MEENNKTANDELDTKEGGIGLIGIAAILYILIGILYLIYLEFWGPDPYRSFMWHLGQATVWPVIMFPALGKIIGGIIVIVVIGMIVLS